MPATKNALIRYQVIDRCLRDVNSTWTLEQIIDEVSDYLINELAYKKGISKRQIEYDLKFMQSSEGYNAPIENEKAGEKWLWYYSDRKFSITNSPLDKDDADKLNDALIILKQFEHFPQFEDIEEIILKLQSKTIGTKKKPRTIIQFESNPLAEGNRHLKQLYQMILKKIALELLYQPFGKESFKVVVHPYLLKEYNNRWFLFGKNHQSNLIQNFALDRIISFEVSHHDFIRDDLFEPFEYFKDVIGVSVHPTGKPEKVILSFTVEQGNYIRTKPLHHSQKILKDSKKEFHVEINVIPNYELKKLLWSFGDAVKVIEPQNLLDIRK
jgi:predicted DNA-binding transcriptional regulator YafY